MMSSDIIHEMMHFNSGNKSILVCTLTQTTREYNFTASQRARRPLRNGQARKLPEEETSQRWETKSVEELKLTQAPESLSFCFVTSSQNFLPILGGKRGLPQPAHDAPTGPTGASELLSAEHGGATSREMNSLPAREEAARPWRKDSGADIFFVICLPYHWWCIQAPSWEE